ncbi:GTPase regulator [Xanthomonas phage XaC1]|nr:GTPase regulator [Xanthomonas phage XaC1]
MFPIPVISQYGNKAPKMKIQKMVASQTHRALLYENGELYTAGAGTSYKTGTGTTSTDYLNWSKVLTDVKDVFVSATWTLAVKRDNTFWHCGVKTGIYGTSGNNTVFTDCTSIINSVGTYDQIRKIRGGSNNSTVILLKSGDLYGIGTNLNYELGLGHNSTVTSWTLTNTSCSEVELLSVNTWVIKNGQYWRVGNNANGQLSNNGLTTYQTWTAFANPTGYEPFQVQPTVGEAFLLMKSTTDGTTRIYGAGYNYAGDLTLTSKNVSNMTALTAYDGLVQDIKNSGSSTHIMTLTCTDGLRSSGYNVKGQLGINNTTDQNVYGFMPCVGLSTDPVQFVCTQYYTSNYVVQNDKVYWAGDVTYNSSTGTDSYIFIPLKTPYNYNSE